MSFKDDFRAGWRAGDRGASVLAKLFSSFAGGGRVRRGGKHREEMELRTLHKQAADLFAASPFSDPQEREEIVAELVAAAFRRAGREPEASLMEALCDATAGLLIDEGVWTTPELDWDRGVSLEEGVELRRYLEVQKRFLQDFDRLMGIWWEKLVLIYAGILEYMPETLLTDTAGGKGDSFHVTLLDVIDSPAEAIDRLFVTLQDKDIVTARLFDVSREKVARNLFIASGNDPRFPDDARKPLILPSEQQKKEPDQLVSMYLKGTPFAGLFRAPCAFQIPRAARFEHCHIIGGTGHGKTQLLQSLVHDDLLDAIQGESGLCVIDSQGDLIQTISQLRYFSPSKERSLADKFVLIDPHDVEYPVCLNMFDMKLDESDSLSPTEREMLLNGTIELYAYMFGALLGAELTQRQGVIFNYLARLMMTIPDATIHTLRELMEDGRQFRPYMEQLEGASRAFFETQFFSKSFSATKQQILTRLWGVLANATLERMFSHTRNKVDVFEAMNDGKIVLINTAKDLLQKDGSQILGRFFIALIIQAVLRRATIPAEQRRPFFVYIDEAHEYFDEHIEDLLNQARKYAVGVTLSHQNLDQLNAGLKATILASTSVKLAGGVSSKDASVFSKEMRCAPEVIQGTKKKAKQTEFACWIKNATPHPIVLSVPLGKVEKLPRMTGSDYAALIETNRALYSAPAVREIPTTQFPEAPQPEERPERERPLPAGPPAVLPEPAAPEQPAAQQDRPPPARPERPEIAPMGRGGKQHKYLQQLVKQLAEEYGYRAVVEQQVEDGSVDVSLEKEDARIACEISVTSTPEQERGNIEKCVAAGYDRIILLTENKKHQRRLKEYMEAQLEKTVVERITFLLPEEYPAFLETLGGGAPAAQTVRGYKVKLQYQTLGEDEQERRREVIAKVIAGSMKRLRNVTE